GVARMKPANFALQLFALRVGFLQLSLQRRDLALIRFGLLAPLNELALDCGESGLTLLFTPPQLLGDSLPDFDAGFGQQIEHCPGAGLLAGFERGGDQLCVRLFLVEPRQQINLQLVKILSPGVAGDAKARLVKTAAQALDLVERLFDLRARFSQVAAPALG